MNHRPWARDRTEHRAPGTGHAARGIERKELSTPRGPALGCRRARSADRRSVHADTGAPPSMQLSCLSGTATGRPAAAQTQVARSPSDRRPRPGSSAARARSRGRAACRHWRCACCLGRGLPRSLIPHVAASRQLRPASPQSHTPPTRGRPRSSGSLSLHLASTLPPSCLRPASTSSRALAFAAALHGPLLR